LVIIEEGDKSNYGVIHSMENQKVSKSELKEAIEFFSQLGMDFVKNSESFSEETRKQLMDHLENQRKLLLEEVEKAGKDAVDS